MEPHGYSLLAVYNFEPLGYKWVATGLHISFVYPYPYNQAIQRLRLSSNIALVQTHPYDWLTPLKYTWFGVCSAKPTQLPKSECFSLFAYRKLDFRLPHINMCSGPKGYNGISGIAGIGLMHSNLAAIICHTNEWMSLFPQNRGEGDNWKQNKIYATNCKTSWCH